MKKFFLSLVFLFLLPGVILFAEGEELPEFLTVVRSSSFSEKAPLENMYSKIEGEVRDFIPRQTALEMKRILDRDRKEGLTTLKNEELQTILPPGCLPASDKKTPEAAKRSSTSLIFDVTHYTEKCAELTKSNKKFGIHIAMMHAQGKFADGDIKNSGFDVLHDIAEIQSAITGEKKSTIPPWTRAVSPDVKYILGEGHKPLYQELPQKTLEESLASFTFVPATTETPGFCPLPGTPSPTVKDLLPSEKEAISKSFARFENDKLTEEPTFNSDLMLTKNSEGTLKSNTTASMEGSPFCLWDVACIKLHFQTGFTSGAGGVYRKRPPNLAPSLRESLKKLSEAAKELSAQNLQVKNEPRAMGSPNWFNIAVGLFELPDDPIQVTWVPIIPKVEKDYFFNKKMMEYLSNAWTAVAGGGKNLSKGIVDAGTKTDAAALALSDTSSEVQEAKQLYARTQSLQLSLKNMEDYEKVVGGQLDLLGNQLDIFIMNTERLKKVSESFASKKIIPQ